MNIRTETGGPAGAGFPIEPDLDAPIRAELARPENLFLLGQSLARGGEPSPAGLGAIDVRARAGDNGETIARIVRALGNAQERGDALTPAATWLLDNHHLVADAVNQIRRSLPRRFYRELPRMQDGTPRVLALAWTYVSHADSHVTEAGFEALVAGYQSRTPLKIGEYWGLPSALRFVLVENLRRLSVRIERTRQMRLLASEVADAVLADGDRESDVRLLSAYAREVRDTSFATQLLYRLRDGSRSAGRALAWLEGELEQAGTDAEDAIRAEHQTLSTGNVTTGNIVRGLRLINDIDWKGWVERVSRVDALLRAETGFARLDFTSRDQYRDAIEELAKRTGLDELELAGKAIAHARGNLPSRAGEPLDIGGVLVGSQRPAFEKEVGYRPRIGQRLRRAIAKSGAAGIAIPVALLTAAFVACAGLALAGLGLGAGAIAVLLALFLLPASEAAMGLFGVLVSLIVPPTRLIGYEYKEGIPDEARTFVVVPTLVASPDDVADAARTIEVHYLAEPRGAVHYALLTDWIDSEVEQGQGDLDLLALARKAIGELNARYPMEGHVRFYLLHRQRLHSPGEGCWMGWERKRGKLAEFNALLRGDRDTTFLPPENPLPTDVRYVMTVDADTRIPREAVTKLVGKMQHPLNRPVIDAATGRVSAGYGILQPRVTASLTTGDQASPFQRVFSGSRGLDPYVFTVSDTYQDLFGAGTFTGKGLYHVDAMEAATRDRIPEGAVLSHDLLEGSLASCALVTDVELVEDYPVRYPVDASRHHRWARGDWQLLPFILSPGNGIPGLSRWKMLDNLRRSLTPIAWVLASVCGWTLLPAMQAVQWQALLVLSLFFGLTFDLIHAIVPRDPEATASVHLRSLLREAAMATAQVALRVTLAAHNAWLMGDAILRTLYRLFISRRLLLEWKTASQAARSGASSLAGHYRSMRGALIVAVVALVPPLVAGSPALPVAIFFALLWAASPAIAWRVSRPDETEEHLVIDSRDSGYLRSVARRHWAYFQRFVTEEHNRLPPDNFQEIPEPKVAARTSPTNIALYLLSTVSARDFGWISLGQAADRIEQTLATIARMERFKGHLFNWYDTRTLQPLSPRYISSVDSGNLAGHLIAVSAACRLWAQAPAAHLQGDFDGILDVTGIVGETLGQLPDDRRSLRPLRQRLRERIEGMRRAVRVVRSEPETAIFRSINLSVIATEIRKLAVAIDAETGTSASECLSEWCRELEATCSAHLADAHMEERGVAALRRRLEAISEDARRIAFEMDFSFLLRTDRKLLSIGYRVDEGELDEACYDLLASEARLASLFAIAKGDVAAEHWFRLGRPAVVIGFEGALASWAGSMFEYLMPPLVMNEPAGGILNQSNRLIVRRQIAYGRALGVPWGVSEAAYNSRDREMNYQYTNFGVPGLGLKRGLARNLVIAPYATLLAAQYRPEAAAANLRRLADLGALGRYGFCDAVDFTPERLPADRRHVVVRNYMAHHQGMGIVAVANAVFEGRMRDRFHSDPVIEASELLLQEKAPREVAATEVRAEAPERPALAVEEEAIDGRIIADPARAPTATHLMSNGRYGMVLTAAGTGASRFGDVAVTRWSADPSEDRQGSFIFLRDVTSGEWWSLTASPRAAREEQSRTLFADDKAVFAKTVGRLRTEVECHVLSEHDGEVRKVVIANDGSRDRHVELTSYAEIALADPAADAAHPAFSKMFVETKIEEGARRILATRRPRNPGEPALSLVHFVTLGAGVSARFEAETDRRAFIGRGREIGDAAAFDREARLGGNDGFTLDPVMAIRCRLRVPAGKKVQVAYWTLVAPDRDACVSAATHLDYPESCHRQAVMSWTRSQVQNHYLGLSLAQAAGAQRLARYLILPHPVLRAPPDQIEKGLGPQSGLWNAGISGDHPIFALRIDDIADIEIVAEALRYQEYLRGRGLLADLVIVNERASSYVQDLQQAIERLCENSRLRGREHGPREHIFAVRRDLIGEACYRTLIAAARVVMHSRNGRILGQIERAEALLLQDMANTRTEAVRAVPPVAARPGRRGRGLDLWNGVGGFDRGGRDYVVRLEGKDHTPHPWINVIANDRFGFHVSAEGAGFTWSRNSRDFALTPWSNDPVRNRPGEAFYIRDLDSGDAFSPTASVLRDGATTFEARHTPGLSVFSAQRGVVEMRLAQSVDRADPVKISTLTIRNNGRTGLRLRIHAYVEWQLGASRRASAPYVVPHHDAGERMLTARNPFSADFADRVAFLACDREISSFTADRASFLGAGGVSRPDAVMSGGPLSGKAEAGRDPCAVVACDIEIAPAGQGAVTFLLGDAGSDAEARELARKHRGAAQPAQVAAARAHWDGFLSRLEVETPDPAFDAMVNTWLPYQALACRVHARSAFYQASGAYGFRDQLQDTLALMLHDPGLARAQILNAASRQFVEGDVQHWWLPRTGAGVRTLISDDVVWLAHAAALYAERTGDVGIFDAPVPFIEGEVLAKGEHDRFFTPEISRRSAMLYDHCVLALELAMKRGSRRGIPLILGGDWNDGMNRVGVEGRGESVWLGWFLIETLDRFAPIAAGRGDTARAEAFAGHRRRLAAALDRHAWDGQWYRRGSFDDGTPLGSASSAECRIDSLAQSWAVLSGGGDPEKSLQALRSAREMLVDRQAGLVRLFTPPFAGGSPDPGYIASYPPGVRENGGQYTHAAIWLAMAFAKAGQADAAWEIFSMLNPVNHARDGDAVARYRVEPYVVAADIYDGPGRQGRGGWTWYTGSAGWLYRCAVEAILGIVRRGDSLSVAPGLPSAWPGFNAVLRLGEASYEIVVTRGEAASVSLDGERVDGPVSLHESGEHRIKVTVAAEGRT